MSGRLFLNAVECMGGRMLLGFGVGTGVVLSDGEKVRDLPDGLAEYAMTLSSGGDQFNVRGIVDARGNVAELIASSQPIPDDWRETLTDASEE